jgi:hypothetical protein
MKEVLKPLFDLPCSGTYTGTTGGYVHMGRARPLTCLWHDDLLARMKTNNGSGSNIFLL